jgi:tetratricopeptide (TPR) repeat protein
MTPQSLSEQAIQFHQRGQLDEAERLYRKALEQDPAAFAPRHLLGILKLQQGRTDEALDQIGAALKINPDSPEALINYGNALKLAGRGEEALAHFDRALKVRPDHAKRWKAMPAP